MLSSQAEAVNLTHSEAQQRALERCCASTHKAPRELDQMTLRGLFQSKLFYCLVTLQLHEHWSLSLVTGVQTTSILQIRLLAMPHLIKRIGISL